MNFTLFKTTIKKNMVLFLIFFTVLTMYTAIIISIYNPDDMESLMSMMQLMPPDLIKAMGFSGVFTNMTGYLASWLYGLLMIAFPMIYSIILGNRLIAKTVDSGSMACLLSTPNSRKKIVATKGIYALASIVLLQILLFVTGILISEISFSGSLNVYDFFRLNMTTALVNMTIISITFFFSCLFNDSKYSLGFGSGIPIMFLLFNMLGGVSDDIKFLKKISIFGWYDPVELVNGANVTGINLAYISIIIILFCSGTAVFSRKHLPI